MDGKQACLSGFTSRPETDKISFHKLYPAMPTRFALQILGAAGFVGALGISAAVLDQDISGVIQTGLIALVWTHALILRQMLTVGLYVSATAIRIVNPLHEYTMGWHEIAAFGSRKRMPVSVAMVTLRNGRTIRIVAMSRIATSRSDTHANIHALNRFLPPSASK
ncbi:MAG: hypothetical protein NVSMB57_16390 [Actinomycetota bacterium]